MATWTEVADGVFHRRYDPLDISVCLVRGTDGLLLVDTRRNPREAEETAADAALVSDQPLRWVVNTHAHYDHTFGTQRFAADSGEAPVLRGYALLSEAPDDSSTP